MQSRFVAKKSLTCIEKITLRCGIAEKRLTLICISLDNKRITKQYICYMPRSFKLWINFPQSRTSLSLSFFRRRYVKANYNFGSLQASKWWWFQVRIAHHVLFENVLKCAESLKYKLILTTQCFVADRYIDTMQVCIRFNSMLLRETGIWIITRGISSH